MAAPFWNQFSFSDHGDCAMYGASVKCDQGADKENQDHQSALKAEPRRIQRTGLCLLTPLCEE